MSINVAETSCTLPYAYERVFDGLLAVLGPAGFLVTHHDYGSGSVSASAGMSARSWGERLDLRVERRDDASADLRIRSSLRLGYNLAAVGKNAGNAARIVAVLSHYLESGTRDVAAAVAAAPPARGPAPRWVTATLGALVLLAVAWAGVLIFGPVPLR